MLGPDIGLSADRSAGHSRATDRRACGCCLQSHSRRPGLARSQTAGSNRLRGEPAHDRQPAVFGERGDDILGHSARQRDRISVVAKIGNRQNRDGRLGRAGGCRSRCGRRFVIRGRRGLANVLQESLGFRVGLDPELDRKDRRTGRVLLQSRRALSGVGKDPTPEAVSFLDEVVGSKEQPVVLFALEWCEFSWSIRKMFAEMDIPYRSVDLNSVEYQDGNRGGDIRAALRERNCHPDHSADFRRRRAYRRLHGDPRRLQPGTPAGPFGQERHRVQGEESRRLLLPPEVGPPKTRGAPTHVKSTMTVLTKSDREQGLDHFGYWRFSEAWWRLDGSDFQTLIGRGGEGSGRRVLTQRRPPVTVAEAAKRRFLTMSGCPAGTGGRMRSPCCPRRPPMRHA